jgi:hypothetical protein
MGNSLSSRTIAPASGQAHLPHGRQRLFQSGQFRWDRRRDSDARDPYGGQFMTTRVRLVARRAHRLQQIFGALIVLTAFAIYFQYDVLIYAWILNFYPNLKGF